ncbi:hypothetical protein GGX14DRAFT_453308 [Mycena pura]|uniref:Uncharacterized protein n=1 Tax=Mycena pura TaxID=153505 RepID=A0AAD6VGP5_9AGAR|nr:hypothetical protein GGX14DRAFT_453308 [Mycena pura]
MNVPQELLDLITHNLYDDILTVRACSLAGRPFARSTRAHIFRRIKISPLSNSSESTSSGNRHTCQELYKLLTLKPHVAPLIEELEIVIVLVGSETNLESGKHHPPWIMSSRILSLVLPLLSLKRISLVEDCPDHYNTELSLKWNKLGRKLKAALEDVFSSPTLESVHLRGIVVESPRQLLSLFSKGISIKDISLSRVYLHGPKARIPWPESEPWSPQLRSILLSDILNKPLLRYFVNPQIDLSHVESLTLASDSVEWKAQILQAAQPEILRLRSFHAPASVGNNFEAFHFSKKLRSIHLFTEKILEWMTVLFKLCPDDCRIETMIFEGPTFYYRSCTNRWPHLEQYIKQGLARLPCLASVEIRGHDVEIRGHEEGHAWTDWEALLLRLMPSLVQRGLLTITRIELLNGVHQGWE